jgi:hypothetical protein
MSGLRPPSVSGVPQRARQTIDVTELDAIKGDIGPVGDRGPIGPEGPIGPSNIAVIEAHAAETQGIHGIADTALLIVEGDSRLTDARPPTAHDHLIAEVTGLQDALDAKLNANDASVMNSRTPIGPAGGDLAGNFPNPTVPGITTLVSLAPSSSARNVIQPTSSTVVPLVVKGAISQASNIQEWQSSSTTLSSVGANGWINAPRFLASAVVGSGALEAAVTGEAVSRVKIGNTAFLMGGGALSQDAQIDRPSAGVLRMQGISAATTSTWIVRAVASQTSNLQEWQDSAGGVGTRVAGTAADSVRTGALVAGGSSGSVIGKLTLYGGGNVPVAVMRAGDAADLTQWQSSAGVVLARVSSAGNVYGAQLSATVGAGSTQAVIANVTGDAGVRWFVGGDGRHRWGPGDGNMDVQLSRLSAGSLFVLGLSPATSTTFVVRGIAAQAGNLIEAQDSAGTVLASVSSVGNFVAGASTGLRGRYLSDLTATIPYIDLALGTTMAAIARSANQVPWTVRGAASQTSNLQEWQDSTAAVMAAISSVGHLGVGTTPSPSIVFNLVKSFGSSPVDQSTGSKVAITLAPSGAFNGAYGAINQISMSAANTFTSNYAYALFNQAYFTGGGGTLGQLAGLYCRTALGGTSPTGTVTNAQALYIDPVANQAGGTPNVTITNQYGILIANQGGGSGVNGLTVANAFGIYVSQQSGSSTSAYAIYTQGGQVRHEAGSASVIPLVLRGAPSQSVNHLEIQNSSSSVLARVASDGSIATTKQLAAGPAAFLAGTSHALSALAANQVGLVVRGFTSQTSDLQQWQDGNGVAKTAVGPNGDRVFTTYIRDMTNAGAFLQTQGPSLPMLIQPASSSTVGLAVMGRASQTGDLLQMHDSGSVIQSRFNAAGQLGIKAAAAPSALAGYGYLYVDTGGALRYRGPTTDTQLAIA